MTQQTAIIFGDQQECAKWAAAISPHSPFLDLHSWSSDQVSYNPQQVRYAILVKPQACPWKQFPNLEAIFGLWAGVEKILADPALPDIPLYRMIDPGMTQGMVDYVETHVMALYLDFDRYRQQQRSGQWQPLDLRGKEHCTIGIMGMGVLGQACAQALQQRGFSVIGWRRSKVPIPGLSCYDGEDGFAAFLRQSNVIVNLLPATAETAGLLSAKAFDLLPAGACLINAGRGSVLDETALLAALDRGQLRHAVLDVFSQEPLLAGHPFWQHPGLTITPHIASVTPMASAARTLAATLQAVIAKKIPEGLVDRKRGY